MIQGNAGKVGNLVGSYDTSKIIERRKLKEDAAYADRPPNNTNIIFSPLHYYSIKCQFIMNLSLVNQLVYYNL